MRVLVTRPDGSGAKTAERIKARGHDAVQAPLIRAEHDGAATRTALEKSHAALAITSAEAVRALTVSGCDLSPHFDTPLYAVGRATAEAAMRAGFRDVITAGGTGEALAETVLLDRARLDAGVLLYLAGEPRAPDFEAALRQAGLVFEAVTVYRMAPVTDAPHRLAEAFRAGAIDAVLFHSRHTAEEYFRLLPSLDPAPRENPAYLCFSGKVAEAVPFAHRARVFVAKRPEEAELLSLLDHCH